METEKSQQLKRKTMDSDFVEVDGGDPKKMRSELEQSKQTKVEVLQDKFAFKISEVDDDYIEDIINKIKAGDISRLVVLKKIIYSEIIEKKYVAKAQLRLGELYYFDDSILIDKNEGLKLIKLAAENNNSEAQYILGLIYYNGDDNIEQNKHEAKKWFQLSGDNGHAEALYSLGIMYFEGEGGFEKDEQMAASLWRLAAEKGHTDAQYKIGELFYHGDIITKNKFEAQKWFQLAAEKDHTEAKFWLAILLTDSDISENIQDLKQASHLFKLVADRENTFTQLAKYRLETLVTR